jgi:hypothetical protein
MQNDVVTLGPWQATIKIAGVAIMCNHLKEPNTGLFSSSRDSSFVSPKINSETSLLDSCPSHRQTLLQVDPRAVARQLDPKQGKRSLSPVCTGEEGLAESQLVIGKVQVSITCHRHCHG